MSEAFLEAVKVGDGSKVRAMLEADPSLANARTKDGTHGAVLALYHGHADVSRAILDRRPTLDLHAAATVGDLGRVRDLVEADPASVHAYSGDGFAPLGLAAYTGRLDVVRYLLSKGADVNQVGRNPSKFTALTGAVASRHPAVVPVLLHARPRPTGTPSRSSSRRARTRTTGTGAATPRSSRRRPTGTSPCSSSSWPEAGRAPRRRSRGRPPSAWPSRTATLRPRPGSGPARRQAERHIPATSSPSRRTASTIVSREAAYERRRWPSPAAPNARPGVTGTFASFRRRSLWGALSVGAARRGDAHEA